MQFETLYYDQVTCIDKQIAELEARRHAIISGTCFTGYLSSKPYMDPYRLDEKRLNKGERKWI